MLHTAPVEQIRWLLDAAEAALPPAERAVRLATALEALPPGEALRLVKRATRCLDPMAVLSAVLDALPDEATADTCAAALGRLGVDARARAFQSLMDGLPRERVLQAAELLMRLDPLLAAAIGRLVGATRPGRRRLLLDALARELGDDELRQVERLRATFQNANT